MKNCSSSNLKSFWGKDYALKIFLALVLVISLLFSIVNVTGAWFTDSSADKKTINTVIKTGEANLNVYQEDSTGTQTLLSKSLPTGYTQLEYIESTGTQYIDSNYYANPKTKVQTDFAFTSLTQQQRIFGHSYDSDPNSGAVSFCCYISGGDVISYASKDGQGEWSWSNIKASKDRLVVTMDQLNKKITIKGDNADYSSSLTAFTRTSNVSLTLFKDNGVHANASLHCYAKMYSFKIWDNDVLVRNFIPAKNSSGTIGMYDLVEDKFYTNQGTGTFTAGAEQISGAGVSLAYDTTNKTNNKVNIVDLPAGYTQLEYLQGDGNQKINTGIVPTSNMRFVGKSYFQRATDTKDNYLFGSGSSYSNFVGLMATSSGFWTGVGSKSGFVVSFPTQEDYYSFDFDYSYSETTAVLSSNLVNGRLTYTDSTLTTANIYLFDRSTAGGTWMVRFYSFTMYSQNVMVRNFIPARNANGVLGMYDTVENKFYTNVGTGSFTAGDEVNTNQLKLLLKNEDLGSSFGIRYKVNFYATTLNGKVLLTSSIAGITAPTSSTNGFVYNSTDGYYYYQNSSGQNVVFEPATSSAVTSKYLMQSFSIDFSSVSNLLGGNSIYMEILVESVNV